MQYWYSHVPKLKEDEKKKGPTLLKLTSIMVHGWCSEQTSKKENSWGWGSRFDHLLSKDLFSILFLIEGITQKRVSSICYVQFVCQAWNLNHDATDYWHTPTCMSTFLHLLPSFLPPSLIRIHALFLFKLIKKNLHVFSYSMVYDHCVLQETTTYPQLPSQVEVFSIILYNH